MNMVCVLLPEERKETVVKVDSVRRSRCYVGQGCPMAQRSACRYIVAVHLKLTLYAHHQNEVDA